MNPLFPTAVDLVFAAICFAHVLLAVIALLQILPARVPQLATWILAVVFIPVIGSVVWFVRQWMRTQHPTSGPRRIGRLR